MPGHRCCKGAPGSVQAGTFQCAPQRVVPQKAVMLHVRCRQHHVHEPPTGGITGDETDSVCIDSDGHVGGAAHEQLGYALQYAATGNHPVEGQVGFAAQQNVNHSTGSTSAPTDAQIAREGALPHGGVYSPVRGGDVIAPMEYASGLLPQQS